MKSLEKIGYVHFYVPAGADDMFTVITEVCNGIEQFVSAVRCENNFAEIEFKYSPLLSHYSVKCSFNKYHVLSMDTYNPTKNVKLSGFGVIDSQRYNFALHEQHQIHILQNKILSHIKVAFTHINNKK